MYKAKNKLDILLIFSKQKGAHKASTKIPNIAKKSDIKIRTEKILSLTSTINLRAK